MLPPEPGTPRLIVLGFMRRRPGPSRQRLPRWRTETVNTSQLVSSNGGSPQTWNINLSPPPQQDVVGGSWATCPPNLPNMLARWCALHCATPDHPNSTVTWNCWPQCDRTDQVESPTKRRSSARDDRHAPGHTSRLGREATRAADNYPSDWRNGATEATPIGGRERSGSAARRRVVFPKSSATEQPHNQGGPTGFPTPSCPVSVWAIRIPSKLSPLDSSLSPPDPSHHTRLASVQLHSKLASCHHQCARKNAPTTRSAWQRGSDRPVLGQG